MKNNELIEINWEVQNKQINENKTIDKIEVGERIKQIRHELGFTQKELAERLETSIVTISKWENGKFIPNNKRLIDIAFYGQMSVDELLYGKFCFWKYKTKELSTCGVKRRVWKQFISHDFTYCPFCGKTLKITKTNY